MNNQLISVTNKDHLPEEYRHTPIGLLFDYHNFNMPFKEYFHAKLLIGTCMDNRIHLRLPENFAYVLRSGGANLQFHDFHISFAIAVGGVKAISLITHNQCGMVDLSSKKTEFVNGLVANVGMDPESAEDHFNKSETINEIGSEISFGLSEVIRFRKRYPNILVAPILYRVEDQMLYLIREESINN
ncbi:carbonic anhydrase [Chloroflexota bacterium]